MKMRVGEIVRVNDKEIARVLTIEATEPKPTYGLTIGNTGPFRRIFGLYELEIVTVEELFAAAGFPIPEGAKLVAYLNGLSEVEWGYGVMENGGIHLSRIWVRGGSWSDMNHSTVHYASSVLPDLRRLPALDAWDALPEVVQQVVQL